MHLPFISDLINFFIPKRCALCREYLVEGEEMLCLVCQSKLPRVHAAMPGNEVENRLLGRVPFEHCTSFCFYNKKGDFASLLQQAKYNEKPWYNQKMAELFAEELQLESKNYDPIGWPYDIDIIMPVPLHWRRFLSRGYNQAESIAQGLGKVWHLPVNTKCLYKKVYTRSQVGQGREQRLQTELYSFGVRHPEKLEGKHILLVDDVLTSGSTMEACANALKEIKGIRLSFLTLGLAN